MNKVKNIFEHTDCISEETLLKYISNKLSPAEKHEVEKHLIDCEMCSDAVEGLSMLADKNKISSITSELNRKIQNRVEKKEVKIIFLRQYRTQLAVAASIILVIGLVWFFRNNMQMKEMDSQSADKMFAEKFSPPPADLETTPKERAEKEQIEPDSKNPVTTPQEPPPPPVNNVTVDEAEKKVVAEESPNFSTVQDAKGGKDIPVRQNGRTPSSSGEEKHLSWSEKTESRKLEPVPAQKAAQLQQDITVLKSEEQADNFYRYKGAEAPKGNVTKKSEVTVRDEDAVKGEEEVVLVNKEVSKNQNENYLESLKEKDKKSDETKRPQSTTTVSNTEVVTATGTSSFAANQPAQDKSTVLSKQENKKTADDRERPDANNVSRAQSGEGDVLAFESGKRVKEKKSGGKRKETGSADKFKKENAPQKVSNGYTDMQTITAAPVPEIQSQTKTTGDINGKMADSTMTLGGDLAYGATLDVDGIAADSAMVKYDKQDYAGAVTVFEQTLKQNPNDEKTLFYSAVSYLSLGQADKAITNFNKVLQNKNGKYYDDAQWYLSLAYIKKKDSKNAKSNLMELRSNSRSKYQKKADETLKEMNK